VWRVQVLLTRAHHEGMREEDAARRLMAYSAGWVTTVLRPYIDERIANRNARIWHGATEISP
jgi:hypothetical protein